MSLLLKLIILLLTDNQMIIKSSNITFSLNIRLTKLTIKLRLLILIFNLLLILIPKQNEYIISIDFTWMYKILYRYSNQPYKLRLKLINQLLIQHNCKLINLLGILYKRLTLTTPWLPLKLMILKFNSDMLTQKLTLLQLLSQLLTLLLHKITYKYLIISRFKSGWDTWWFFITPFTMLITTNTHSSTHQLIKITLIKISI
jgi:hypothetical protein